MELILSANDVDGNAVVLETTYPPFTVREAEDFVRKTGYPASEFTQRVDDRDPTVLRWLWVWFHRRNGVEVAWEEADFDLTSFSLAIRRDEVDLDLDEEDEANLPTSSEGEEVGAA